MVGLIFALGAAVSYAGLDLLRKVLADRLDPITLLAWMTLAPVPVFAAWVTVGGGPPPGPAYWLPGLLSAGLNVAANLCFLMSVRHAGLGSTIPLLALTPVFSSLVAVPLLGEVPGPFQGAGIFLVVLGAFWLYREEAGASRSEPDDGGRSARSRLLGMAFMVVVASCWSAATPLDRLALRHTAPAVHALVLHAVIALAMLIVLAARRRLRRLGAAAPFAGLLALTVLVSAVALTFQLYALENLWAGLVETVKRGVGSASALLAGALLLREHVTWRKVAAVGLTVAGVALVLL